MYVVEENSPEALLTPMQRKWLNDVREFAKANKRKWVCVYEGPRNWVYEEYFYMINHILRHELSPIIQWPGVYNVDFQYPKGDGEPARRILVKYK